MTTHNSEYLWKSISPSIYEQQQFNQLKSKDVKEFNKYVETTVYNKLRITSPDFALFIKKLLTSAGLGGLYTELIMKSNVCMGIFSQAFTHLSWNEYFNYEALEFCGDGVIKSILTQYIPIKYSKLITTATVSKKRGTLEGVHTDIKIALEKKKTLSSFALKLGMVDFVRTTDLAAVNEDRTSTLEDIFEAFIGALVTVIDKSVDQFGVGYKFAFSLVQPMIDGLPELTLDELSDNNSKLNVLKSKLKHMKITHHDVKISAYHSYINNPASLKSVPRQGYVVMDMSSKTPVMFYNGRWIPVLTPDVPLIEPYGEPDSVIFANTVDVMKDGRMVKQYPSTILWGHIIRDDSVGGTLTTGKIIGMGIGFKKDHAKQIASGFAVDYLQKFI